MGILKKFAGDTLIYGLGKGLKKAVGLIMLPIYTQVLSVEDYGILETMGTVVWFLTIILTMGLDSSTEFFFFKAKDEKERGVVLFTIFSLQVIMVLPIISLSFFSAEISEIFFKTPDYKWAVLASLLIVPANLILTEQTQLLRYFRQAWHYNLSTLIKTIFGVGLGIYLVVILEKGVLGVQVSAVISSVMAVLGSFLLFSRKKYTYAFSWEWAKKLIRFGFPLIWAMLGIWIYTASDRFFLIEYADLRQVGLYSIGSTFSQPILLVNMAVQMSIGVLFFSTYHEEKDPEKPETKLAISDMFRYYLSLVIVIGLTLSVFGLEILRLITTEEFVEGALVIPFMTFSFVFAQAFQFSSKGIMLEKKNWYFTALIGFTALINVILNFLLIPKYGFMGAASSTLFSNFIYWLLGYLISQHFFRVPFRLVRVLVFSFVSFSLAVSVPVLQLIYDIEIYLLIKVAMVLFGLLLPFLTGIISYEELRTVLKRVKP